MFTLNSVNGREDVLCPNVNVLNRLARINSQESQDSFRSYYHMRDHESAGEVVDRLKVLKNIEFIRGFRFNGSEFEEFSLEK